MAFNLPPGCSVRDIETAAGVGVRCAVCHVDVDACPCLECPLCGMAGCPECYIGGSCGGIAEALPPTSPPDPNAWA